MDKSSNRKGVEETISGEREAFKASEPSPLIPVPAPKKEAAIDASPPLALELLISGDKVTSTVYFFGILKATMMPMTKPMPTALYKILRIAMIFLKISIRSISISSAFGSLDTAGRSFASFCSVMINICYFFIKLAIEAIIIPKELKEVA